VGDGSHTRKSSSASPSPTRLPGPKLHKIGEISTSCLLSRLTVHIDSYRPRDPENLSTTLAALLKRFYGPAALSYVFPIVVRGSAGGFVPPHDSHLLRILGAHPGSQFASREERLRPAA